MAITSVIFRLPKVWQPNLRYADVAQELATRNLTAPTPQDVADAIIAIRRRKLPDPAVTPNAGSFFHNPVVDAALAAALAAAHPGLPRYPQARWPGQAGSRLADRAGRLEGQAPRPGRHV